MENGVSHTRWQTEDIVWDQGVAFLTWIFAAKWKNENGCEGEDEY